jgi:YVTN family beta-propeller protein
MNRRPLACIALLVAVAGCSNSSSQSTPDAAAQNPSSSSVAGTHTIPTPQASVSVAGTRPLAGMPPLLDPHDVYAADRPNHLSPVVGRDRPLIYVPNSLSNTVTVIDPQTYKVIGTHPVGALPQHVTPSYDLRHLYVLNDNGNSVTVINPRNGSFGRTVPVADPYNMYFTPDGKHAIVVAERLGRLDFLDSQTLRLQHSLPVNCRGIDHADFSANGRYAIFSCEFSGQLVKVDIASQRVVGYLSLPPGSMPQDVKLSPDGSVFYVADMMHNGVWLVDGDHLRTIGFRHTGKGAHGLYVSRNSRFLYVTNRMEGSISLIDLRTRRVVRKWRIPGGGSPDMGGVSANGKVLWLSGRYNGVVYAISTANGHLIAKIPVGRGPHGLCVYPQPGRYSLGHTGVFR